MATTINTGSGELRGNVKVYRVYGDGTKELRQDVHNIVIENGLYRALDLIGGISTRYIDSFAWGSGATTAFAKTSTSLLAQTGSKAVSYISRAGSALTFSCTISFSEGNTPGIINEFALYSSGTTPINFAQVYFADEAKTGDYELQIDHTVVLYNSGA